MDGEKLDSSGFVSVEETLSIRKRLVKQSAFADESFRGVRDN